MKTPSPLSILALLGVIAISIPEAGAKDQGRGKDKPSTHQKGKGGKNPDASGNKADKQAAKEVKEFAKQDKRAAKEFKKDNLPRFKNDERDQIVRYFSASRDDGKGLPPGLAKNLRRGKALPPGWQSKIAPGAIIDEEWFPAFSPISDDVFPDMIPIRDTRLYWHGDRVVRVYEPERRVIDVVEVDPFDDDY